MLQMRPFVKDIDFIDRRLVNVLTLSEEGKWLHTNEVKQIKLNETLLQQLPRIVKAPMSDKFVFAITQQTISIVNKQDGREFVIVKQRAHSEHDCLDGLFITYEADE